MILLVELVASKHLDTWFPAQEVLAKQDAWLWLEASPVHSCFFWNYKGIFCYFSSLLVNSGYLQLTSAIYLQKLYKWN